MYNTINTRHEDYQSILLASRYSFDIRIHRQKHFLSKLIQLELILVGHEIQVSCYFKSIHFSITLQKTDAENKKKGTCGFQSNPNFFLPGEPVFTLLKKRFKMTSQPSKGKITRKMKTDYSLHN